jgi:cation diffusion facilitator family transporter
MGKSKNSHHSTIVVAAAIISNTIIFICKLAAALITRSSAMLAESIHSMVDIGNGVLVAYGMRRSNKPPDSRHPFGYGSELYFWSLIVAISIFGIGGGMSLYEGIRHLQHPTMLESPIISYVVIAIGIVVEGASLVIAVKHFNQAKGASSAYGFIRASKDPSLFTVVFEDTAAVIGLLIAFVGIGLSELTGNPMFDGLASVMIGLLLMVVAFFLARESKDLLIGEGVEKTTLKRMRRIITAHDDVEKVGQLRTLYLGPDNLIVAIDVKFTTGINEKMIDDEISEIEAALRAEYPQIKHAFIEVASLADVQEKAYRRTK